MADNAREFVDTYENALAQLQKYHEKLRDEIIPKVTELVNFVLPVPGMEPLVREALQGLYDIEKHIAMFVLSGPIVIRLYVNAEDWVLVSTKLSSVAGDLQWENRPVPTRWRGQAAEAYEKVVAGQLGAVEQVQTVAQTVALTLNWLAMSLLTLYVAVLGLLTTLYATLLGGALTALGGPGTATIAAAGVLAGLAVTIPQAATQLATLAVTAAESYARARTFIKDMRAKALDMSKFPNGNWPRPDPARYNDATVLDGDPSDWTVVG